MILFTRFLFTKREMDCFGNNPVKLIEKIIENNESSNHTNKKQNI